MGERPKIDPLWVREWVRKMGENDNDFRSVEKFEAFVWVCIDMHRVYCSLL